MSGRRQHYIPQSFQRGFLTCEKSKQTCVYRVDNNYVSKIDCVAAQRDFYSKQSSDGIRTLDDIITDYESRLGHLLETLRNVEIGATADASIAAEVIAHLTPRVNSVRRIFGSGATGLVKGISEIFTNQEKTLSLLGLAEPAPNQIWNKHIVSTVDNDETLSHIIRVVLEHTKMPKVSLERLLFMYAKESMLGNTNPVVGLFQQAVSGLLANIGEIVSDGHKKMLNNGVIAEPRKKALEEFTWSVQPAPEDGAIMPDCIALGFDEEEGGFLPYIMTSTASAVVMPLTSRKLLVGVSAGSRVFDLSDFNHEASECSDEIFIAASSKHKDLSDKIGKRWKGKMDSIVQDALADLSGHIPPRITAVPPTNPTPFAGYQLTFIGWAAGEDVSPISKIVQSLVEKLRQWLDLTWMDGITFTSDVEKTLAETERGFDTNAIPEGMPDYIAQGAAALLIMRDKQLKVRIVLNKKYALCLVGEDTQEAEFALHLLVAGLSIAHTIKRFESTLPSFLMEPITERKHDAILHCAMRKALRAYRYAYDSAEFGADDVFEQEFSNYLTQTFNLSYAHIERAKEEHAADSDHFKLFNEAHGAVADILIASARLIGHLDGMGKVLQLTPETSTGAAVAARQLNGWLNAFAYDLQQFWKKESWTRESLYGLNIHVERLLWPCGIFIYTEDGSQETMILSFQAG